jgi:hypothetical protein
LRPSSHWRRLPRASSDPPSTRPSLRHRTNRLPSKRRPMPQSFSPRRTRIPIRAVA